MSPSLRLIMKDGDEGIFFLWYAALLEGLLQYLEKQNLYIKRNSKVFHYQKTKGERRKCTS